MTFLSLPPELRQTIYDLALPRRHLHTDPFCALPKLRDNIHDVTFPERKLHSDPLRGSARVSIPPLFLTSHQIYAEAASVFYSKATLCIPLPPPESLHPFPSRALLHLPQYLRSALRAVQISQVRGQEERCLGSVYRRLLGWLAFNTDVTDISIDRTLMLSACRRHACRDGEAAELLEAMERKGALRAPMRAVKVFSHNDREFWEGRGMGAGRGTIVAEQAPNLRMFACITDSKTKGLTCDPRGTPKGHENDAKAVGEVMDLLRAQRRDLSDEEIMKTDGDGRWLFQVVFVL
jgi:hypothetical protein